MNRKPGFPSTSCSIKLPDGVSLKEVEANDVCSDLETNYRKRQQLITFGHSQWGFKNWNWTVTKQDLDFVDFANGKHTVGVVAFVSVTIKTIGIHREDVGYATSVSNQKGSAIHNARKASITNALRETLLSFGGNIANQLIEQLSSNKIDENCKTPPDNGVDKNINVANRASKQPNNESKNSVLGNAHCQQVNPYRKDSSDSSGSLESNQNKDVRSPQRHSNNQHQNHQANLFTDKVQPQLANSNARGKNQVEVPNYPANQMSVKPNVFPPNNHLGKVVAGVPTVPPPAAVVPPALRPAVAVPPAPPVHPSNVCQPESSVVGALMSDEELRAERKRRQRQKQEEFRIKQMQKNNSDVPLATNTHHGVERQDQVIIFSSQDTDTDSSPIVDSTAVSDDVIKINSNKRSFGGTLLKNKNILR